MALMGQLTDGENRLDAQSKVRKFGGYIRQGLFGETRKHIPTHPNLLETQWFPTLSFSRSPFFRCFHEHADAMALLSRGPQKKTQSINVKTLGGFRVFGLTTPFPQILAFLFWMCLRISARVLRKYRCISRKPKVFVASFPRTSEQCDRYGLRSSHKRRPPNFITFGEGFWRTIFIELRYVVESM